MPSTPTKPAGGALDHERLNKIVHLIQTHLSQPQIRTLNNRAIQAKIFQIPEVSRYMTDLRRREMKIREDIMQRISHLIYRFQEFSMDVTLARAGILKDDRVHAGSSLNKSNANEDGNDNGNGDSDTQKNDFDLLCLDAKERMYLILKSYDWLKEFFQYHPLHFYENSFQFVNHIPPKHIPIKVKVIGLGIGGSLAVSGLKKSGIKDVVGYDKRARHGPRSVTSRFQNASWRAYDIAENLLDAEAFEHLVQYQQRIHVKMEEDGSEKVMLADRVQIILGDAIDCALASAERYGADLRFNCDTSDYYKSDPDADAVEDKNDSGDDDNDADIVALFAGARTSEIIPGLIDHMQMHTWNNLSSKCCLWLEIKLSDKKDMYTARNVEVGAEKWHFTIESARNTKEDIMRIRDNLIAKHDWNTKVLGDKDASDSEKKEELKEFQQQVAKIEGLLDSVEEKKEEEHEQRFDYIFTNAPDNEHNQTKLKFARENGNVVIEGGYQVDIKIASKSMIDASTNAQKKLLEQFSTGVIVTGGDACVPPNPMAAYGATLACEFAAMLVQLSVAHGHVNAVIAGLKNTMDASGCVDVDPELLELLEELKSLFSQYYDAKGLSENYFQWMQTLICNLYSLPPTL